MIKTDCVKTQVNFASYYRVRVELQKEMKYIVEYDVESNIEYMIQCDQRNKIWTHNMQLINTMGKK